MNYIKNLTRFPVKIQFNQFHALKLKGVLLNFSSEKLRYFSLNIYHLR